MKLFDIGNLLSLDVEKREVIFFPKSTKRIEKSILITLLTVTLLAGKANL